MSEPLEDRIDDALLGDPCVFHVLAERLWHPTSIAWKPVTRGGEPTRWASLRAALRTGHFRVTGDGPLATVYPRATRG